MADSVLGLAQAIPSYQRISTFHGQLVPKQAQDRAFSDRNMTIMTILRIILLMMMIEDGNLCLLLAIEGLMAMIESPHFKTTFASLNNLRNYNCYYSLSNLHYKCITALLVQRVNGV